MDIFALFGKIVASVGGAGLIIIGLSSWIGKIWADKLMETQRKQNEKEIEKFKSELHKELELLKAKNEKMNYITKTQFDAEFKMYQELSEACIESFISVNNIFPIKEKIETEQFIITASKNTLIYSRKTYKYAPFLKKELFEKFQKLSKIFCDVLSLAKFENKYLINIEELKELRANMHEIQADIYNELREYLQSLKVQED